MTDDVPPSALDSVLGGTSRDSLDERLFDPLVTPPADFEQRVLAALTTAPRRPAAPPRRAPTWRRLLLPVAGGLVGLAGLAELVLCVASVWLFTAASG